MYCNHEICITTLFFITKYWGGQKILCPPVLPINLVPGCVSWIPFCILFYVSRAVVSGTYPWVARLSPSQAWSKGFIRVGWVWWRHHRAPFSVLPRAPPTLKPPLVAWCSATDASNAFLSQRSSSCSSKSRLMVYCNWKRKLRSMKLTDSMSKSWLILMDSV